MCFPSFHGSTAEELAIPQRLAHLRRLRRVRDRIGREYASPLDVTALARSAHTSAGYLNREFERAYGESPYDYLTALRNEQRRQR
jgi:AraC-like DNA-binding protein